jgi:hypothetical protein
LLFNQREGAAINGSSKLNDGWLFFQNSLISKVGKKRDEHA